MRPHFLHRIKGIKNAGGELFTMFLSGWCVIRGGGGCGIGFPGAGTRRDVSASEHGAEPAPDGNQGSAKDGQAPMENLAERKKLLNPLNYIGSDSVDTAEHIRIRVGTRDGDTSFYLRVLVLSLENKTDADVDYALVWDQPHGNADYDGELVQWIEKI